ncbi:MAG: alpha-L-fucosidase [Verrucomicrobia bacterium]|nr:alpha-L-fucosidase [Verrucomicrobiota bacterium]
MKTPLLPAILLISTVLSGGPSLASAAETPAGDNPSFYPGETAAQKDARLKWWREARFGMFIHWGLYAVPAGTWQGKQIPGIGEWIMNRGKIPVADYAKFAEQFNPVKYNADTWVRLAKEAGMKYIVITSKHHDGFALFKSAASPYNLVDATPFKRDALKELAAACQKHGIKLGFYYSQAQDWHHRGGAASGGHWDPAAQAGDMDEYIRQIAVPQVREILTNYGPIAILWWDTPTNMNRERADMLAPLVKLQPGLVLNNRLGGGYLGDTETPENRIPATGYPRDWEACMTMNDTWGFKSYDHNWKSAQTLIRNLVDIASKGGNYLLNVGPTAEGEIPAPSVERLKAVGAWMQRNGEAIYGTMASPFLRLGWGRATQKPDKLYLHVFNWPADGNLVVPMSSGAKKAYLLGAPGQPLKFSASPTGLRVSVPAVAPDAISSTLVLEGVGKVVALPPPPIAAEADGSVQLPCDAADLFGKHVRIEGNTNLNLGAWRGLDDYASWQVKFTRPGKYDVLLVAAVPANIAGSTYAVTIGSERLEATTVSTAGKDYQPVKVGTITVTQAGTTTVALKPVKIAKGELLRLRALTLKPVAP